MAAEGGLLSRLTPAERMAFPAVRSAVRESITATSALRSFRSAGGHITNANWYDLYRATEDLVERGARLKYLRRDARLDPNRMLPPIGSQLREYSYLVEIRGKAPRHPGESAYYMTISSSENLTRGEIEDTAMGILSKRYGEETGAYKPVWTQATRSGGGFPGIGGLGGLVQSITSTLIPKL